MPYRIFFKSKLSRLHDRCIQKQNKKHTPWQLIYKLPEVCFFKNSIFSHCLVFLFSTENILGCIYYIPYTILKFLLFLLVLLLLFHSLLMLLLLTLSTFNWKARVGFEFFNYVKYKNKQGIISSGLISTKKEILLNCYWHKHECLIPACKENDDKNTNNWTNSFTVTVITFRHTVHITESHLFNGKLC